MRPLMVLVAALILPLVGPLQPAAGEIYVDGVPDRAFTLTMSGHAFNGFTYPDTPLLQAVVGEKVQITIIVPPTAEAHTFHMHGHPWLVPSYGARDTVLLKPGDVYSFFVIAGGADGELGDWMYHCHFDEHMAGGMWGIFRVEESLISIGHDAKLEPPAPLAPGAKAHAHH